MTETDSAFETEGTSTEPLGWLTSPGDSGNEFDSKRSEVRRKVLLSRGRRHFLYALRRDRLDAQTNQN